MKVTMIVCFVVVIAVAAAQEYLPPSRGGGGGGGGGGRPSNGGKGGDDGPSAPANYEFSYEVQDAPSNLDFGHKESRQGDEAKGMYHVLLPDGRTQIVEYTADNEGYKPQVKYEGVASVSGPSGGGGGGGGGGNSGYNYPKPDASPPNAGYRY